MRAFDSYAIGFVPVTWAWLAPLAVIFMNGVRRFQRVGQACAFNQCGVHWLVGCVGWQVVKVLEGHTGDVCAVAISSDGAKIVSGSLDHTVRIWSMETGEVPASFRA